MFARPPSSPKPQSSPNPPPLPPTRSSKSAADINGFFRVVGEALTSLIKTDGAPEGTDPIYIESFPKERLTREDTPFDAIVFHVLEGVLSPVNNEGKVSRRPWFHFVDKVKDLLGYNRVDIGWWETYTVEFEIWSKTNFTANFLAVWFHRFLIRYAYYYQFFAAHGIDQFKFEKRLEDDTVLKDDQELYRRRLCYSFRLQFIDTFIERQLTDLTLNVKIKHDVETIELPIVHTHHDSPTNC